MHARTLSPQWSAAEAAHLHSSRRRPKHSDKAGVERNHCGADTPKWEGIKGHRYLAASHQGKVWHKAVLRGKPGTDRDPCRASSKNCVLPMDSHSGSHEGSPHEVHGCTREPSPHSGRQPKPPTSTQLSQAEAQRQSRSGEKPLWGRHSQVGGHKRA